MVVLQSWSWDILELENNRISHDQLWRSKGQNGRSNKKMEYLMINVKDPIIYVEDKMIYRKSGDLLGRFNNQCWIPSSLHWRSYIKDKIKSSC